MTIHTFCFVSGNDNLYFITSNKNYSLRIDLDDDYKANQYAVYSTFAVASEVDNYLLTLGTFSGIVGKVVYDSRA